MASGSNADDFHGNSHDGKFKARGIIKTMRDGIFVDNADDFADDFDFDLDNRRPHQ